MDTATDTALMPTSTERADGDPPGQHVVLILSPDAVAAALLGALVETLGYLVRFYRPQESPEEAIRRAQPTVAMVDCEDPTSMRDEFFGRARMRNISVVIFGSSVAMQRVRKLAEEHDLDTILLPVSVDELDDTLRKAVERYC